jgi:hypothetical protein
MKKCLLNVFSVTLLIIFMAACNNQEEKTLPSGPDDSTGNSRVTTPEMMVNAYAPVDISPMDMSYFPNEYPKLKMTDSAAGAPLARVIYSRPHLGGRELFKDVLKHGEPWRLGANEATELQLYRDATVQGKKIKAGRYILYAIPQPDKWTIVLNSNIDSWGLIPDSSKDIARFDIPVKQTSFRLEYFTMVFEKKDAGAELVMAWDKLESRLPIMF